MCQSHGDASHRIRNNTMKIYFDVSTNVNAAGYQRGAGRSAGSSRYCMQHSQSIKHESEIPVQILKRILVILSHNGRCANPMFLAQFPSRPQTITANWLFVEFHVSSADVRIEVGNGILSYILKLLEQYRVMVFT